MSDPAPKPYLIDGDTELQPGETLQSLQARLAGLENKLEPVSEKIVEGDGTTATTVTFHPAMIAAKKMEKKIHDQLEESNAKKQLRSAAFEAALFGTGIMKGPFAVDKEYPNWDEDGEYNPIFKTIPQVNNVSVWNFYPDPDSTNINQAQYVIERHKMSRSQLRSLKKRPHFRPQVIEEAIEAGEKNQKMCFKLQNQY